MEIIKLLYNIEENENMEMNKVVCDCLDLTVQDIKDAISNGAKSYEEVEEMTQVGTICEACIDDVKELVEELLG